MQQVETLSQTQFAFQPSRAVTCANSILQRLPSVTSKLNCRQFCEAVRALAFPLSKFPVPPSHFTISALALLASTPHFSRPYSYLPAHARPLRHHHHGRRRQNRMLVNRRLFNFLDRLFLYTSSHLQRRPLFSQWMRLSASIYPCAPSVLLPLLTAYIIDYQSHYQLLSASFLQWTTPCNQRLPLISTLSSAPSTSRIFPFKASGCYRFGLPSTIFPHPVKAASVQLN